MLKALREVVAYLIIGWHFNDVNLETVYGKHACSLLNKVLSDTPTYT